MPEVVDWLKTLGMSEYAERFAESDIDFAILSDLTDQDLEKIGVASLGHRRKLLRAIALRRWKLRRATRRYPPGQISVRASSARVEQPIAWLSPVLLLTAYRERGRRIRRPAC
jgi:hypothetical protein